MKKLGLVVAVLMVVATPAWAAKSRVDITCSAVGKVITVSYKVNPTPEEPNKVSGFGLDITVDSGANIIDVNNYPLVATNGKYWVYPGSIDIVNGEVNDVGSPVADPNSPGALGGIGKSGITIEMGSLYSPTGDNSANAPPWTGTLLSFKVDKDCCVTITENATRGGVVLTNPALNPDVNAPGSGSTPKFCTVIDCYPSYSPFTARYNDWKAMDKPACWCPKPYSPGFQCDGDADGKTSGAPNYYRVYTGDISLVATNWKKKIGDAGFNPCADVDHKSSGAPNYYRVYTGDISKVASNWKKKDADLGGGTCPRP